MKHTFEILALALGAAMASAASSQCSAVSNMIIGADSIGQVTAKDAGDCCDTCSKTYQCRAYTFVTDGSGACYLKNNIQGNQSEADRISGVYNGPPVPPGPPPTPVPIPRACEPPHDTYPFCNPKLPMEDRISNLISLIELEEIPPMLTARESPGGSIPRLGVPEYDWGVNAVHGVQTRCGYLKLANGSTILNCPTSFPCPNALGASWNMSNVKTMAQVIATELRSLWLQGVGENHGNNLPHAGLDVWSPNINNAGRDPRWGRNQETNGEAPLMLGDYGKAYTEGVQVGEDKRFYKAIVTLKHYSCYTLEGGLKPGVTRHNFNAVVTPFMLSSTFLVPFEAAVRNPASPAKGVMCSYNAVNGEPSCANTFTTHVMRERWNYTGYVTSDSGAIGDIFDQHHYTDTWEKTVAAALEGGETDINSGNVYKDHMLSALNQSLITRASIDRALRNALRVRFELGLFDPIEDQPYWHVPPSAVNSAQHQSWNLDATRQSLTLLKNEHNALPVPPGSRVAVIGPHGMANKALVGNYLGQICPEGGFGCVQTPYDAVVAANKGANVTYAQGCTVSGTDKSGFPAAVAAAKQADVVALFMGIDQTVEREGHDRASIDLPGVQHELVQAVAEAAGGRPVVVFLINGGMVAIEPERSNPAVTSIVEAFYPGTRGSQAMAEVLFGAYNPGGKLPITLYHADIVDTFDFFNMNMATAPGRSYRFYRGPNVSYPFGWGLSYTNFTLEWAPDTPMHARFPAGPGGPGTPTVTYKVVVRNVGSRRGDEVVQCYYEPVDVPANQPQPGSGEVDMLKELFSYQRVTLSPGESATVECTVDPATARISDRKTGDVLSAPGTFTIAATNGVSQRVEASLTVTGDAVVIDDTMSSAAAAAKAAKAARGA